MTVTATVKKRVWQRAAKLLEDANRWTEGMWYCDSNKAEVGLSLTGNAAAASGSATAAYRAGENPLNVSPNASCQFCMEGAIYACAAAEGLTWQEAVDVVDAANRRLVDIPSINDTEGYEAVMDAFDQLLAPKKKKEER